MLSAINSATSTLFGASTLMAFYCTREISVTFAPCPEQPGKLVMYWAELV